MIGLVARCAVDVLGYNRSLIGQNLIYFAKTEKNHKQFNYDVCFVQIIEIRAFSLSNAFSRYYFLAKLTKLQRYFLVIDRYKRV